MSNRSWLTYRLLEFTPDEKEEWSELQWKEIRLSTSRWRDVSQHVRDIDNEGRRARQHAFTGKGWTIKGLRRFGTLSCRNQACNLTSAENIHSVWRGHFNILLNGNERATLKVSEAEIQIDDEGRDFPISNYDVVRIAIACYSGKKQFLSTVSTQNFNGCTNWCWLSSCDTYNIMLEKIIQAA